MFNENIILNIKRVALFLLESWIREETGPTTQQLANSTLLLCVQPCIIQRTLYDEVFRNHAIWVGSLPALAVKKVRQSP